MRLSLRHLVLATVFGLALAACAAGSGPAPSPASLTADARPATTVPEQTSPAGAALAGTTAGAAGQTAMTGDLVLTGLQAQEVGTLMAFIRAYNAGRLDEALALFADDPLTQFSDCDHRENREIGGRGRDAIAQWLAQRIADHDRLVVARIELSPRDSHAMGVVYARRTSDTLRALGQPDGFAPQLATKVIFTDDGMYIETFAHGCG